MLKTSTHPRLPPALLRRCAEADAPPLAALPERARLPRRVASQNPRRGADQLRAGDRDRADPHAGEGLQRHPRARPRTLRHADAASAAHHGSAGRRRHAGASCARPRSPTTPARRSTRPSRTSGRCSRRRSNVLARLREWARALKRDVHAIWLAAARSARALVRQDDRRVRRRLRAVADRPDPRLHPGSGLSRRPDHRAARHPAGRGADPASTSWREHRATAEAAREKPQSTGGAIAIIAIWTVLCLLFAWLAYRGLSA